MITKQERYDLFLQQLQGLLVGEKDLIANLANIAALYMEHFKPHWVGFYLAKNKELVLGPFQGPVACTRIGFGKGVCGSSWENQETLIVGNVHEFKGHIACSSESNSEIVVPIINDNGCVGVFDIDSIDFNHFDQTDQVFLEKAMQIISVQFN